MTNNNNIYFSVLRDSWKIAWKNKILWFFALFTLFLSNGRWDSILSSKFSDAFKEGGLAYDLYNILFTKDFFANFIATITREPLTFIIVIFVALISVSLIALIIFIGIVFQGGLVHAVFKANVKQKIDVHESLLVGRENFWQVLSLNIITKFSVWGLSFLIGFFTLMTVFEKSSPTDVFLSIFSILAIIILAFISFIFTYALAFVVLKGRDSLSAIRDGFNLFRNNLAINLEIAAFLFIINYLVALLAIFIKDILLMPLTSIGTISLYMPSSVSFGFYFVFIPIAISIFMLAVLTLLSVFNYSVWVTMFVKLTGDKKILSFTRGLFLKIKNK